MPPKRQSWLPPPSVPLRAVTPPREHVTWWEQTQHLPVQDPDNPETPKLLLIEQATQNDMRGFVCFAIRERAALAGAAGAFVGRANLAEINAWLISRPLFQVCLLWSLRAAVRWPHDVLAFLRDQVASTLLTYDSRQDEELEPSTDLAALQQKLNETTASYRLGRGVRRISANVE